MLSSSSSLFTSLPARPPTPPKDVQEHVQNALDFLKNGHEEAEQDASEIARRQLSTDTPPVSSPVSSVGAPPGSNATKKVGFSPFPPTFHEIPKAGVSSSPRDRLLRSTPRPRITKSVKSILKLSSFAPPPTPDEQEQRLGYFSPEDPASFGKMLQSVLKSLLLRRSRHGWTLTWRYRAHSQHMMASLTGKRWPPTCHNFNNFCLEILCGKIRADSSTHKLPPKH